MEKETEHIDNEAKVEANVENKQKDLWLVKWVKYQSKSMRIIVLLFLIFLTIALTLLIGYYCLFLWLPSLWNWGFSPLSWKCILSFFGALFLVMFPFFPLMFIGDNILGIFKLYTKEAEEEFTNKLNEIEKKQSDYETVLKKNDVEGLIPLITYSRIELEQYHKIGLNQTQKSYRYSVIAMWIGFFIIAFGIVTYIIPSQYINPDLISGNFQIITVGSGIMTELISALFLWIYKSSMSRLTYFYNRQVFIHNALFAYKISNTMNESDGVKKVIVEKILEFGLSSNKVEFKTVKKA